MRAEPLVIGLLTAVGSLLLASLRRTALLDHAALALPLGAATYAAVACVLVVAPVPFVPALALGVAVAIGLGALLAAPGGGTRLPRARQLVSIGSWPAASAVLSAAAVLARGVRLSPDSYEYLRIGGEAAAGELEMPFDVAVERQLLTGVLHELARTYEGSYLASLAPLFAISALSALWWLHRRWTGDAGGAGATLLAAAVILATATSNRFVFNAFYINSHLMIGTYVLLAAAVLVLVAARRLPSSMVAVASICTVPVVLARPEGPLLIATVLLPAVVSSQIDRSWRRALVLTLAGAVAAWWVLGLARLDAPSFPTPVLGAVGATVAVLGGLLLADRGWAVLGGPRMVTAVVTIGAWLALVAIVLVEGAGPLQDSIHAMWRNAVLGDGLWGGAIVGFTALVLLASTRRVGADLAPMLLPLSSFVPVALILAYLRGGGYRVGPGDSLNRMWLHVLLLAAGFAVVALGSPAPHRAPSEPT